MNPLTRPIAEETFHRTPNPPMSSALASATSLPKDLPTPDGSQPNILAVNLAPVADAFQLDGSVGNYPMSDAANDQATPEPPISTSHSEGPVERVQSLTLPSSSASAPAARPQAPQTDSPSRIRSPSMLHGTTASPAASGQDLPVQLSSKTATATSAHGVFLRWRPPSMQSCLPVVPIAGEQAVSVAQSPKSSQSSPQISLPGAEMKEVGLYRIFKMCVR